MSSRRSKRKPQQSLRRSPSVATPVNPNDDDTKLADYVRSWLERIGSYFSEPEIVEEALTHHRDLWESLYQLDNSGPASDFANPS